MQPPGGGGPPGDRKAPLPPPFGGGPPRPGSQTGAPAQPQPQPYPQPAPQPYAQPYPQPAPQPYAQPYPQPQPAPQPYPQPQPYPPPQPYAQPGYPPQPPPAGPAPQPYQAPLPAAYVPGAGPPPARDPHSFGAFLQLSLRRAFRLRIEPEEVTPEEKVQLASSGVNDPVVQAFLAWRRSVMFMVACLLVPLIVLKAIEIFNVDKGGDPASDKMLSTLQGLQAMPLLAEVAFCVLLWVQLKRWTDWRKQRRAVAIGWLVFFLAPFVIFLYPMRSALEDALGDTGGGLAGAEAKGAVLLFGMIFSVQAMMTLAPKAVSLIPGLVRAALVSKFMFPGAAGPGWLVVLAAPIYALFVYVVLIVPYQITGSGWFVGAILSITTAEYLLARGGFDLARPMTRDQAIAAARKARSGYLIAMVITAVFLVAAMASLIEQLDFKALSIFTLIGTFLSNVWILTVITTDAVITNLDRARGLSAGTTALAEESSRQLAAFVGEADHTPAPGPKPPT